MADPQVVPIRGGLPKHGLYEFLAGRGKHLRFTPDTTIALQSLAENILDSFPDASPLVKARILIAMRLLALGFKAERIMCKEGLSKPGKEVHGLAERCGRWFGQADEILADLEAYRSQKTGGRQSGITLEEIITQSRKIPVKPFDVIEDKEAEENGA